MDALKVDFFAKRHEQVRSDEQWAADGSQYQVDYVLDSELHIGSGQDAFVIFEGQTFRWINSTAEHGTIISFGVKSFDNKDEGIARLNRMLSAIVWHEKVPVAKRWGAGGPRRPYPYVYAPRTTVAKQSNPEWLQGDLLTSRTTRQSFALALFREGINSRSDFYSYLCFWKVIEYVLQGKQREWINAHAVKKTGEKEAIAEISKAHSDLGKYFWDARRNAIAHVLRKTMNPDDPRDEATIQTDVRIMEDFARLAIEEILGVK